MDPFRSWYQNPALRRSYAHSPSFYGVPVYDVDQRRETGVPKQPVQVQHPQAQKKSGPRGVVRIPVEFHGSGPDRRPGSALMIQKVFRGYLVRKNMRKIGEIKSQADEIEAKLSRGEVAEMVRRDGRERLRLNESLMNLLFKLDGIRGVDLGVRVFRKSVTRKVILLQERIDSIVAADSEIVNGVSIETADQESEAIVPEAESKKMQLPAETHSSCETEDTQAENLDGSVLGEKMDESTKDSEGTKSVEEQTEIMTHDVQTNQEIDTEVSLVQESADDTSARTEDSDSKPPPDHDQMLCFSSVEDEEDMDVEKTENVQVEMDDTKIPSCNKEAPVTKRTPEDRDQDDAGEGECVKKLLVGEDAGKDDARDGVDKPIMEDGMMLKKMMEDNAKMMRMMARLYDRNEMQLHMLDGLTNRVNYLEKAYMCEKLRNKRRKNKKNRAGCFVEE